MKDVPFVASLIATLLSGHFHRSEEIKAYLERFDEKFEERDALTKRFSSTLDSIHQIGFDRPSRA
jgi:hypothetical protein